MILNKDSWRGVLISPKQTVMLAIEKLDQEALRVLLVVDENQFLQGVVTDGDIRRHLLKQGKLDVSVVNVMNKSPKVAFATETKEQLLMKMQSLNILHLPIVDEKNKVIGLETLDHLTAKKWRDNWVVFMAGGLGTRLHPLTLDSPKPLIKIANKPILEILLENFIANGFHRFYFSVNYKAAMIQDYFGSGEKWGVEIHYIHEDKALGTVGSLNLLPVLPQHPFFVVNADIMTNLNFDQILEFHQLHSHQPIATVCVRQHQHTVPYGVVKMDSRNHNVIAIEEKPAYSYFVNAGIYILNPSVLDHFPEKNIFYDMPSLLSALVKKNLFVATFPIREYWLDVGSHDNLSQAIGDYQKVFI
ncbi:MAG: alcohol dehydrogenase [Gammaproteobacteria bacterium CG_4_10_14_0_8_um_filter_38_16]|nr:MAG: alcohol dehydrogenase [Gammaproteobacteria bacterium CG_4_10_14_0_8_um_filter_38_16]PJA04085.1 MAG: alcohol dehydrogenase [Gammaproteobacteria bacterium CG_4_10_14_0_2_um_filter_38_22]PJB10048.1 MAG: alcohol dehydrogenase [Gammaproteobacteria bacterium CG_4_9_14_3_um_filter_38_9]